MRFLLILLLLSISLPSGTYGQSRRKLIDSLHQKLEASTHKDTSYARTLDRYSRIIRQDSITKSFALNLEVLDLSKSYGNEDLEMEAWYTRSLLFVIMANYDSSIYYADKALPYFFDKNKTQQYLNLLSIKGEGYLSKADFSKAIDLFLQIIEATQNRQEPHIKRQEGIAYGEISSIYYGLDLWDEAIEFGKKGLDVVYLINDSSLISAISYNLANCYMYRGDLDTAASLYQKAVLIGEQTKRDYLKYPPMGGSGILQGKLGHFDSSKHLLSQSIELAQKHTNPYVESYYTIGLGKTTLLAAAAGAKGYSYSNALNYAKTGYQQSLLVDDAKTRLFALEVLSESLEKTGNHKEAVFYYRQLANMKDSLFGSNKRQEIAIRQIRFDTELHQQLLTQQHKEELRKEKTTQAYLMAISSLTVLSILVFVYLNKRRTAAQTAQIKAQLHTEAMEAEMKALRSQMNPHFIFNALNSIRYYVAANNTQLADRFLLKYAELMRQIFENAAFRKVSLSDDLKALDIYLQVESLRLPGKFEYIIDIDKTLETDDIHVPSLLIQPVVENSIWHGITPRKDDKGFIRISVSKKGNMLSCIVEDNGVGYKPEANTDENREKPSGLGITQTRIELINKQQNNQAAIKTTTSPEGTRTELLLPFDIDL